MNKDLLWRKIKEKLFIEMTNVHYNTWIKPIVAMRFEEDKLYLNATIRLIKRVVTDKYLDAIERHAKNICQRDVEVVVLEPGDDIFDLIMEDKSIDEDGQLSLLTGHMDQEEKVEEEKKETPYQAPGNKLNARYTFENFVRGKSNDFALAVAMGVAENPGTKFNPLFIYGGSGLGKTHLMQAIGHRILEKDPTNKLVYITSENFMNEFISTITDSKNSVSNSQIFRNKYRNADVLMIDDIQFIAGKEGTQEEIFHTFNSLREAKKQIILTSDKPPKEIKNLEERLVTRFSGGILADIQKPDFETRVAIIRHKMKMDKIEDIPNNVVEFIASNVTSNIRELEGSIIKVMAYYNVKVDDYDSVTDEELLDLAKEALSIEEKKQKPITLDLIKEVVAQQYGLTVDDLIGKSRQQAKARPRQIAMHLSRQLTDLSLIKIANSFNRDHSTVMHGDDKIETMRQEDTSFNKEVEELISLIKSR